MVAGGRTASPLATVWKQILKRVFQQFILYGIERLYDTMLRLWRDTTVTILYALDGLCREISQFSQTSSRDPLTYA